MQNLSKQQSITKSINGRSPKEKSLKRQKQKAASGDESQALHQIPGSDPRGYQIVIEKRTQKDGS